MDLGLLLGSAGPSREDRGGPPPPPSQPCQGVLKIGLDFDTDFGGMILSSFLLIFEALWRSGGNLKVELPS